LADHNGDNSASASATTTSGGEGGIVRIINDDISIRSGKYGNYIFYKTVQMKKPKFVSLKNFNKNIYTCSDTEFISLVNV
jgi:topoisomerase IA-like protein